MQTKAVCSLPVLWLALSPVAGSQLPSDHIQLGPTWTSGGASWPWEHKLDASDIIALTLGSKIHALVFTAERKKSVLFLQLQSLLHRFTRSAASCWWREVWKLIWGSHEFWRCVAITRRMLATSVEQATQYLLTLHNKHFTVENLVARIFQTGLIATLLYFFLWQYLPLTHSQENNLGLSACFVTTEQHGMWNFWLCDCYCIATAARDSV